MNNRPNQLPSRQTNRQSPEVHFNVQTTIIQTAALTLWMPIETIRLRLQCQSELMSQKYLEIRYKSWKNAANRIYRTEGLTAFWKGGLARIVSYGISTPVLAPLLVYYMQTTSNDLKNNKGAISKDSFLIPPLLVGASLLLSYPFEYARVRLANSNLKEYTPKPLKQFSGIRDVFSTTLQYEGFSSLYRGLTLSFIEAAFWKLPLTLINLRLLQLALEQKSSNAINHSSHFPHMMALAFGFLFAYPANTVRKRMMMSNLSENRYPGWRVCYKYIKQTEGIKGFYKGGSWFAALWAVYAVLPSFIAEQVPINVFV
jgi:hypothetical protein